MLMIVNRLVCVFVLLLVGGVLNAEDEPSSSVELQQVDTSGQSLRQYKDTISRLESEKGAYHPALGQTLLELGNWYRAQGDFLNAVATYEKALHISKVNSGLHNLAQLEIVELLIATYSTLQDRRSLDKYLHHLLWLYRRNYNDDDDHLVAIIERVGRWYMQAYQLHSGGEAVSYLVKADDLYDEAARIIVRQHGEQARQLISVLNSSAIVNYHIASDVKDVFKMSFRDIREAMITNKRASPYLNEVAIRDYYFDQSFYKGKRALQRIIDIYADNLPAAAPDYAQALVYQGDLYLALNRKWNAMKNYKKAYAILIDHEVAGDTIDAIFGSPRQVEPFTIPGQEQSPVDDSRYVDAVFDVPRNGWPRDIRLIASRPENDDGLRIRGKHAIAATRYRPRFEDGQPVATEAVSLRYVFTK